MQKKEKRGSLESLPHQRCIKSCIQDGKIKNEESLYLQGFYEKLATDNETLCKPYMYRIYNITLW